MGPGQVLPQGEPKHPERLGLTCCSSPGREGAGELLGTGVGVTSDAPHPPGLADGERGRLGPATATQAAWNTVGTPPERSGAHPGAPAGAR